MSRSKKLKARDRVTLKNTRDGLVERNVTTGEDVRVSKREVELVFRSERPVRAGYSQVGNSRAKGSKHRQVYRQGKTDSASSPNHTPETDKPTTLQFSEKQAKSTDIQAAEHSLDSLPLNTPDSAESQIAPIPQKTPSAKSKPPPSKASKYQQSFKQPVTQVSPAANTEPAVVIATDITKPLRHNDGGAVQSEIASPSKLSDRKADTRLNTGNHSKLRYSPDEAAPVPSKKGKKPKSRAGRIKRAVESEPVKPTTTLHTPIKSDTTKPAEQPITKPPKPTSDTAASVIKPDKPGKLHFNPDEIAPDTPKIHHNRKLGKAQKQADRVVSKLEKAQAKLPQKKKLRTKRVFDEKKGKAKRKLYFESEVKSQAQHTKGALPLRPIKAAGSTALAFGHRKLFQVERENVGTEAAHKSEMLAEGGIRSALRFRKTAPYRKVEKLERKAAKKSINLTYQKTLAENPKLKSNLLSRMWQKRKIKKDYAKAAREAQKAAKRAKKTGSAVADAGKALVSIVRRHPVAAGVVVLTALLLFAIMSLIGAFGGMGSGGLGGILTASYLAEDVDVDNAELYYTEWETDLQMQIANAESTHAGYDEYRYNVGDISHNPYELMAYLTVKYQNFTYSAIESELRTLFGEQYSLTFTPTTETRYADPEDADEDGDYEPYDWKILTVTLTTRSFGDVVLSHLSGEESAHYALLLQTKGSRQYIGNPFGDLNWLPYVTSYYGYRIHPISGVKDLHRGVDIGMPTGTEIHSGQAGTVTFAGYSGNYGNVVVIEDDKGLVSKYAHCETLLVSVGQTVKMGDVIATVGSTGNSTGPHLHLEVLKNGQYLNPIYFADTGSFNLTPTYGDPGMPMGDGTYAALIAEAEKYLGYPYVWGGSSPSTSFDCSGYVSWVLTHSGVKNTGRIGAQALYNLCTPVSPADARPGDLIFFTGTYSAPLPVTHVGIYVGGGRMLHCGNPIQYTSIETTYWQNHFYAFGRISGD